MAQLFGGFGGSLAGASVFGSPAFGYSPAAGAYAGPYGDLTYGGYGYTGSSFGVPVATYSSPFAGGLFNAASTFTSPYTSFSNLAPATYTPPASYSPFVRSGPSTPAFPSYGFEGFGGFGGFGAPFGGFGGIGFGAGAPFGGVSFDAGARAAGITAPPTVQLPQQQQPQQSSPLSGKVIVAGSASVQAERKVAATQAIRALQAETRKEPGCIQYEWSNSLENPNEILIWECWESDDALQRHLDSEHVKVFKQEVGDLFASDPSVQKTNITDWEDI